MNEEEVVEEFKRFLDEVKPEDLLGELASGLGLAAFLRHADLALRQVEHETVDLSEPLGRERSSVRALEVLEHPALTLGVQHLVAARPCTPRGARPAADAC